MTVWTVGPNGKNFSNISLAIASGSVQNGDTIDVYSFTYNEAINITKSLTIRGIDDGGGVPILSGVGLASTIVTVSAEDVRIEGFHIKSTDHETFATASYRGLFSNGYDGITVYNCEFSDIYWKALELWSSSGHSVTYCNFHDTAQEITSEGYTFGAIILYEVDNSDFSHNTFTNIGGWYERTPDTWYRLGDCILLIGCDYCTCDYNVGTSHHYGISLQAHTSYTVYCNYCTASYNQFSQSYYNLYAEKANHCKFEHNICGSAGRNIWLRYSTYCEVNYNNCTGGIYGMTLDDYEQGASWACDNCIVSYNTVSGALSNDLYLAGYCTNSTFHHNTFQNSGYGAYVSAYCTGNRFYFNDFITGSGLNSVSGTNYWVSASALTYFYNGTSYTNVVGNRYGDYSGVDADPVDGIGDTSYSYGTMTDTAPLMAQWSTYASSQLKQRVQKSLTYEIVSGGSATNKLSRQQADIEWSFII